MTGTMQRADVAQVLAELILQQRGRKVSTTRVVSLCTGPAAAEYIS